MPNLWSIYIQLENLWTEIVECIKLLYIYLLLLYKFEWIVEYFMLFLFSLNSSPLFLTYHTDHTHVVTTCTTSTAKHKVWSVYKSRIRSSFHLTWDLLSFTRWNCSVKHSEIFSILSPLILFVILSLDNSYKIFRQAKVTYLNHISFFLTR